MSRACSAGRCTSTCALTYANCGLPAAPLADDGCEQDALEESSCGGCGNACAAGLSCMEGFFNACGCQENAQCEGIATTGAVCSSFYGVCQCQGEVCNAGEKCMNFFGPTGCSCNGGPSCVGNTVACCKDGCKNLLTDALNCGACGHACPPGFTCETSSCRCTASAQCDAGGGGTCNSNGYCVCGAQTCTPGKRCQPGGVCG
jgi:hypothetical protein